MDRYRINGGLKEREGEGGRKRERGGHREKQTKKEHRVHDSNTYTHLLIYTRTYITSYFIDKKIGLDEREQIEKKTEFFLTSSLVGGGA